MISDGNQDCELTGCQHDGKARFKVLIVSFQKVRVVIMVIIVTNKQVTFASKIKMAIKFVAIIKILMIYFYLEYHLLQAITSTTVTAAELSNDIQQVILV